MTDKPYLPGILQQIADVAGEGAALAIARDFGGRRLSIPKKAAPGSLLVRCVGAASATKIIAAIGYGIVPVPIAHVSTYNSLIRDTASKIDRLDQAGHSVSEIASETLVTERTVKNHRQRRRELKDPRQPRMI